MGHSFHMAVFLQVVLATSFSYGGSDHASVDSDNPRFTPPNLKQYAAYSKREGYGKEDLLTKVTMAHKKGQQSGTCPLNHLLFHGLAWRPENAEELGQPLVLMFDHDRQQPIDKVWVAKLATCFLRRKGTHTLFSEKNLAFQTYRKDMIFNAPKGHSLLYENEDKLWLAVCMAHKGLSQPNSKWFKIDKACETVGFEQVDMWHVPERGGPPSAAAAATAIPVTSPPVAGNDELSSSDDESSDEEDTEQADAGDEDVPAAAEEGGGSAGRASGSNEARAGQRQVTKQQRRMADTFNELGEDFDPD
jgi:hypothetical protein